MSFKNLVLGSALGASAIFTSGCPNTVEFENGPECTVEVVPLPNPGSPSISAPCQAADKLIVLENRAVVIDQNGAVKHLINATLACMATDHDSQNSQCADFKEVCGDAEAKALQELAPQPEDYTRSYIAARSKPVPGINAEEVCCVIQFNFGPGIEGNPTPIEDPSNKCDALDDSSGNFKWEIGGKQACDGAKNSVVINYYCNYK